MKCVCKTMNELGFGMAEKDYEEVSELVESFINGNISTVREELYSLDKKKAILYSAIIASTLEGEDVGSFIRSLDI